MILPKARDLCLLLVRTDYSDDEAWRAAFAAGTAVYEGDDFEHIGACFQPVESPELAGLSTDDLVLVPRADYVGEIAVADARTMKDHTLVFVDFNELRGQIGRTFRSIPNEAEAIVANLSLSNMDFHEFADNVQSDGVFRGF